MACMENVCTNSYCDYYQFSNESPERCPKCGKPVKSYFDELAHDFESPIGDDYENAN